MNLLTAKPFSYLPPPNWFRELTAGVSRLLQPDLPPPHAPEGLPETYLEQLRHSRMGLSSDDREGLQRSIVALAIWNGSTIEQTAAFWRRSMLSLVDVVVIPSLLRSTSSLGTLDRNLRNAETIVLLSSAAANTVMRLGRTTDGLHRSDGLHTVVRTCDLIGKLSANAFSVTLAMDLPLRDTFKLAALALCADGCRHIYDSFRRLEAFVCLENPSGEHLERLSSGQRMSAAIWNLHLANACMDLADSEFPRSQFSDEQRHTLNTAMDDILGEDIAVATCFLLAQVKALGSREKVSGFRLMDHFSDQQRLLTWRKCLALSDDFLRLEWIANSSMKKRHKMGVLEVPKLKTSLWQRITMRSAGDVLTDAMYPLKF